LIRLDLDQVPRFARHDHPAVVDPLGLEHARRELDRGALVDLHPAAVRNLDREHAKSVTPFPYGPG